MAGTTAAKVRVDTAFNSAMWAQLLVADDNDACDDRRVHCGHVCIQERLTCASPHVDPGRWVSDQPDAQLDQSRTRPVGDGTTRQGNTHERYNGRQNVRSVHDRRCCRNWSSRGAMKCRRQGHPRRSRGATMRRHSVSMTVGRGGKTHRAIRACAVRYKTSSRASTPTCGSIPRSRTYVVPFPSCANVD